MSTLRLALPLATAALIAATLPAAAQQSGSGAVTCTSSERQGNFSTCEGGHPVSLTSDGPGAIYGIRLSAPAGHCMGVAYSVVRPPYATGNDVVGMTGILRAGQSEWFALGRDFAAGTHPFRIQAIGVVEGCNAGQMQSWGVNYEFMIIPE